MTYHGKIDHVFPPRDNQKVAIDNAMSGLYQNGFHGLFLEMSLGKSKVALNCAEILNRYHKGRRVLVVCPKAIQGVWLEEIPKHMATPVSTYIWQNKKTNKEAALRKAFEASEDMQILIVRLEMFQRDNKELEDYLLDYFDAEPVLMVLDESSKIKNVDTQRTPRLINYTRGAVYRLILTGTPWTESPLDIFSQMEFLQTGFWYRYDGQWKPSVLKKHWWLFKSRYAVLQEITLNTGRTFKTVVGTRRTEEIAKKIAPYITQQKKDDWLDLPEKIHQTLHVEMAPAQAKAYEEMKQRLMLEVGDELITAANAAVLLSRLRQIAGGFYPETGEPICKEIAGIDLLLEDVYEYPGKVVIAASFVAELEGIVSALVKEYGEDQVTTYYGATKDRENEVARFRDHAKFMVLNPQSGAYGLNLQFASLMYLYSRPFSYEQNAQLQDRIHRPGQKDSCIYKEIIHVGTVQEKVAKSFEKKKGVVDAFDQLTLREYLTQS